MESYPNTIMASWMASTSMFSGSYSIVTVCDFQSPTTSPTPLRRRTAVCTVAIQPWQETFGTLRLRTCNLFPFCLDVSRPHSRNARNGKPSPREESQDRRRIRRSKSQAWGWRRCSRLVDLSGPKEGEARGVERQFAPLDDAAHVATGRVAVHHLARLVAKRHEFDSKLPEVADDLLEPPYLLV